MAHEINGYDLAFTGRRSWKAKVRRLGKVVDIVPVTWTKGYKNGLLEVWFRDVKELEACRLNPQPFMVALAKAKDYSKVPHEFAEFVALFRVIPTGKILSDHSIETKVLERVTASENA